MDRTHLRGATPNEYLWKACQERSVRKVHYGLSNGADPNNQEDSRKPVAFDVLGFPSRQWPFKFEKKWLAVIEVLILHGYDLNAPDVSNYEGEYPILAQGSESGNTLLHHASFNHEPELIQYLLSKGANPAIQVASPHLLTC